MRLSRNSGFSFTELIVAFSVLVVSVGVMVPSVRRYMQTSRVHSTLEDIVKIEAAVKGYLVDVGTLEPLVDIDGFSSDAGGPTARHFLTGDDQPGWAGPYLSRVRTHSALGPRYDIQVLGPTTARIDLLTTTTFKGDFAASLTSIDMTFDDDGDTTKGRVWGDAAGIHYGIGIEKQ